MEGKESQNDILRLRKLEQARHEHSSTSNTNENAQSSNLFNESANMLANGYPIETALQSDNN